MEFLAVFPPCLLNRCELCLNIFTADFYREVVKIRLAGCHCRIQQDNGHDFLFKGLKMKIPNDANNFSDMPTIFKIVADRFLRCFPTDGSYSCFIQNKIGSIGAVGPVESFCRLKPEYQRLGQNHNRQLQI